MSENKVEKHGLPKVGSRRGDPKGCSFEFPKKLSRELIKAINKASDPTFGYETQGATSADPHDIIRGSLFTCPLPGKALSITVTLQLVSMGDATAVYVKCAIYRHSDLALIDQTEELTYTATFAKQWKTFNFVTAPALWGIEYVLVVWAGSNWDTTAPTIYAFYDAGETDQGHVRAQTYGVTFPSPLPTPVHTTDKYSIYCTYFAYLQMGLTGNITF